MIHRLLPKGNMVTLQEHSSEIFMPSVGRALQNCSIVDFVWDEYRSYSLKAMTEAESGNGVREFVGPFATIPKNLNEFLCDS